MKKLSAAMLTLALSLPITAVFATPYTPAKVLTTIKPVQLIAMAITDGVSTPGRLLPANASPHDYQLRPSDIKRLHNADLVVWTGPALEQFLVKPLAQLPRATKTLVLFDKSDQPQRTLEQLQIKQPTIEKTTANKTKSLHEHDDEDDSLHSWLAPEIGAEVATKIAHALMQIDASNTAKYQQNLNDFLTQLETVDKRIHAQLNPLRTQGYFVFHDAYSAFESHYGLNHLGAFMLSPERKPGAKHLNNIRQKLTTSAAICIFTEPQFNPAIISAVTQGLKIDKAILDPLASEISLNKDGYFRFLESISSAFSSCLSENSQEYTNNYQ